MTGINIAGAIDKLLIFDDPEYCRDESKMCGKLFRSSGVYYCGLFDRKELADLEIENHGIFPIKCDQCKMDYQKAIFIKRKTGDAPMIKNDGSKFGNSKFGS